MQYDFFHSEIQSRHYGETKKTVESFMTNVYTFLTGYTDVWSFEFRTNEPDRRSNRISPICFRLAWLLNTPPSLVQGDLSNTTISISYARTRDVHINLNRDGFENSYIRT